MRKKLCALLAAVCLCLGATLVACKKDDGNKIAATSKLSLGNYATSLDEAVKNGTVPGRRAGFTS
ncbi:MAG: hypothetical protein K2L51_03390 [Clostridiales bacterium]|nr:hypothetical protein [Clostridiales bacterium]